ncbi:HTH-type transcriptional regulator CdhR [Roseovarius litorisediminis]|uniref:HTH-type transcriptional regulator CdhR n=1 Tax=Roseovarius litorisediminis TaxID=1312363 RepID=A0A1Y5RIL4_9RHOB|nr:GlxA family transcriptional regulator [Roseovarius litorisediminis]SLN18427.1 HTH-type transcriptional regulator CdhR [Roseovarius litorisediminis]
MTIDDGPKRYVFLLVPGFSPLGLTCAQEALALANRFAGGRPYYDWMLVSEDGEPVTSWNGLQVGVTAGLVDLHRKDTLIVCAGVDAVTGSSRKVLNWLRRETRKGIDFGALSSGTWTLAMAGLLNGKHVTTHWEYASALAETFPDVEVQESIYAVDGRVFTCAGSASSMDLMLDRIHSDYGAELATWVADQMVYTAPRAESHSQRISMAGRMGVRNSKLVQAIEVMRENLEDPMPPGMIASKVGLSTRQLERLFSRYLGTSPKKYYLGMRLEKARNLLIQTELSLIEICVLCGFKAPSHFSKTYRKAFGVAPSRDTGGSDLLFSRK